MPKNKYIYNDKISYGFLGIFSLDNFVEVEKISEREIVTIDNEDTYYITLIRFKSGRLKEIDSSKLFEVDEKINIDQLNEKQYDNCAKPPYY